MSHRTKEQSTELEYGRSLEYSCQICQLNAVFYPNTATKQRIQLKYVHGIAYSCQTCSRQQRIELKFVRGTAIYIHGVPYSSQIRPQNGVFKSNSSTEQHIQLEQGRGMTNTCTEWRMSNKSKESVLNLNTAADQTIHVKYVHLFRGLILRPRNSVYNINMAAEWLNTSTKLRIEVKYDRRMVYSSQI